MLAPLHLLSFSTLLGTQIWQSFAVTKIAFQSLPRSAFTTLNKRIFRAYFLGQSILVLITAITAPSNSVLENLPFRVSAEPSSSTDQRAITTWAATFAVMACSSLLNLFLWEPRSRRAMIDRTHQETRDGGPLKHARGTEEDIEPTPEMQAVQKRFRRSHAMCIHLNLVTMGATLVWGWTLASRLKFD